MKLGKIRKMNEFKYNLTLADDGRVGYGLVNSLYSRCHFLNQFGRDFFGADYLKVEKSYQYSVWTEIPELY